MKTAPAFPEKRNKGKCAERARTQYSCQAVEVVAFLPRCCFVLVFPSVLKSSFGTFSQNLARSSHADDKYGHFHQTDFFYSDHIGKTHIVCARPKIFYFGHHALCTHLLSKTAFSTFATVRHIYYLLVTTEKSETSLTTPGLLVNIVSGPRGLTGELFELDFFAGRFLLIFVTPK